MDSVPSNAELGRNEFLRLLTTQLQNQDPMNPMDSADFTAQLAQFSSLEQQFNSNERLSELVSYQSSMSSSMSVALLGRSVTLHGGDEGTVVGVEFNGNGATFILDGGRECTLNEIKKIDLN